MSAAAATFGQGADLPNLKEFKTVGFDGEVAYAVRDVKGKDKIKFDLLAAQARVLEDKFAFNPDNWSLMSVVAGCKDRSYQILSEQGVDRGEPFIEVKGKRKTAQPGTAIYEILNILCTNDGLTAQH